MENEAIAGIRIATPRDVRAILECSRKFGPAGDTAEIAKRRICAKHSSIYVILVDNEIRGWFQISKDGMANRLLICSSPPELVPLALEQLKDTLLGHTDRFAKVLAKEENFELMSSLRDSGYWESPTTGDAKMFVYRIGSGGTKGPRNRMLKYMEGLEK